MCFKGGKKDELKLQKFVINNFFPLWVLEICEFLKLNNINYFCIISSSKEHVEINILNVPQNQWALILNKTKQLNLIFDVNTKQRAVFNKDCNSPKLGSINHFEWNGEEFIIREAEKGENVNKIHHTLTREL